jgi:Lrp/AsnC family transcriptional regulator, leucine-responsive regulatory protein
VNSVPTTLDATDWALLEQLQADARLSFNELARRLHVSAPTVAQRVRRLEERGVLTGYHAHVDLERVGRPVLALVHMRCYGSRCITLHPEVVAGWPEVLEVVRLTGDICCVVRVATSTVHELERVLERLWTYSDTSSSMILSTPVGWQPVRRLPPS